DLTLHDGDNPQREIAMRAVGVEAGQLHNDGIDLATDSGRPWQFRGYHVHVALNVVRDDPAKFGALVDEMIAYGGNTVVAIGNHLSQWKHDNGFALDARAAGHQDLIARYFDVCADRKVRGFL